MARTLSRGNAVRHAVAYQAADRRIVTERLTVTAVTIMTVATFLLRVAHIDFSSLWLDEGYTLLFSGLPVSQLITVGGAHEHPPLYYLLVHVMLDVHHSYLVPRSVSVVASTASIPVLYVLGSRLFDRAVGLIAALFLAVSPFHFWFADDGRAYALAGLFVLLSYLLITLAVANGEHRRPGLWIGYSVCLAACLYTEYTTIFALLPQALFLLRARHLHAVGWLVGSWLGAGLMFLPWLPVLLRNAAGVSGNYWIPKPTWPALQDVILEALGLRGTCPQTPCSGTLSSLPGVSGHETLIAGVALVLAACILAWALLTRDVPLCLTALWFALPLAIVLLLAVHRSLFLDRVFLDATFGLYLVLGWAMVTAVRHRPAIPVALILALLLVGGAIGLHTAYSRVTNADWKTAVRDFDASYRPGQAVVYFPGPVRSIVTSYLPAGWHPSRGAAIWFRQYLDVPGWQHRYPNATDDALLAMQLDRVSRGERAVWLLAEDYTNLPTARHWFSAHGFDLRLSQLYDGDTRIELWVRDRVDNFGPAVVPGGFRTGWKSQGTVALQGATAAVMGRTALNRTFPVRPGSSYAVNIMYRCTPPAYPTVLVQALDAKGHTHHGTGRFGTHEEQFPRSKWYDWPVTGVWVRQPFGFVAPPDDKRAVLTLRTLWGSCSWRDIAVYRER